MNGKVNIDENLETLSAIKNKDITLYINYLLCDIYSKLPDANQTIEIDDCFEMNMCNKERYYLIKQLLQNKDEDKDLPENQSIIVLRMANMKDPYCIECVKLINDLLEKYPNNFWASPNEFFTDGTLINYGSDFGLMPSIFEPGGIVQHEFFIAGTPVLAFKTGGLKDSVFEYDYEEKKGNGVVFDVHEKKNLYLVLQERISYIIQKTSLK